MRRFFTCAWATLALATGLASDLLAADTAGEKIVRPASERFSATDVQEEPSFRQHMLPLMGRLGCNGRACHGSFQGRGGFRLSLFGYDFDSDYKALTGGDTPRANAKNPQESLILQKPTLTTDHEGGERMKVGSWEYRLFQRWLESGAKGLAKDEPEFVSLEVTPHETVYTKPGQTTQLKVVARWSNGVVEDVTPISRFRSNDESIATVDVNGKVTCTGQGDTHIVAFYDNGVVPVQVILPVSEQTGKKYPKVEVATKIDGLVVEKLKKLGIVPSALASDDEFLRRVSLDLVGSLPSAEEVKAFLADTSPNKRAKKIDELLSRPAYAAWWATKLCDITGNNPGNVAENNFSAEVATQWYKWIERRVGENVPYDKIIEGIVLASSRKEGQSFEDYCEEMSSYVRRKDPADFTERETMPHYWSRRNPNTPKDKALTFSYAFLGVRLQCAECHKHPFDQWTKQDFESFTAFFTGVNYNTRSEDRSDFNKMQEALMTDPKATGNQARQQVTNQARDGKTVPWREVFVTTSAVRQPRNNQGNRNQAGRVITPKLLGGEEVVASQYGDPRQALMEWMRTEENPYFAKAFVNRVWAGYFNVGIIEPPDDMNLANPPSNEKLLDYLTKGFVENKYDMKWLHREIANSHTYQRSWQTNPTNQYDVRNFSHSVIRRLPAEVAYDAVVLATANDSTAAALHADPNKRSIGLLSTLISSRNNNNANPRAYALTLFGRPQRVTSCDCERSNEASLLQTIFLRNDSEMLGMIDRNDGWVKQLVQANEPPRSQNRKEQATGDRRKEAEYLARLEANLKQLKKDGKDTSEVAQQIEKARKFVSDGKAADAKKAEEPKAETKSVAQSHDELIREAYLRTLSRLPNNKEAETAKNYLAQSDDAIAGVRDLLWVLLNTKEFIVNR